ncbi:hypothetical protein P0R31_23815 [Bradyrhizobium yuanmingense]|uniref:hypothetical protein n=1 Tax=Bradyrhizobium yuanmingense TaxID=108015 RepID=UPI0023B8C2AD|nr:hypothetical protein [Bradyrhizobium yuanmingense]MDF0520273.1 hypothetical protein [Bradyrhizobium yuanmingense]
MDAKIHCRILFSGDARRRSPFLHFSPADAHAFVEECVNLMLNLGGRWFSAWIDQTRYPQQLKLVNGLPFDVNEKHLAGLACFAAIANMQHHEGTTYLLAFDTDRTKIDWGLARLQATHFTRVHSNAVELSSGYVCLLDMADICAYATAQAILAAHGKPNKKAARFLDLAKSMNIQTSEFCYQQRGVGPLERSSTLASDEQEKKS